VKHCKTCRHFKAVYPENAQLGNCEFLMVSDNQPCGHMIQGNFIDTKFFKSSDANSLCLNRVMDSFGCPYHDSIKGDDDDNLFHAFQRLIDYECNGLKMAFDECTKEGHEGGETQLKYQFGYNSLVALRQRMLSDTWVLQFLNKKEFDMPEATEMIYPSK
jgi:hypothetical protein